MGDPNDTSARPPGRLRQLWATTIGKKYVVAITGGIMIFYVVVHMLGNLKALQGAGDGDPAIDRYAEFLRTVGDPVLPRNTLVWAIRLLLIVALVVHVTAILQLRARNQAARPAGYPAHRVHGSVSARTMTLTGGVILAFIVFHILHFTTGTIHPTPFHHGAVYANVHDAFQKWWLVATYLIVIGFLGMHLRHALWSASQTGGVDTPDRNPTLRALANAVTALVVVGFALIPILFATGILPDPVITVIK